MNYDEPISVCRFGQNGVGNLTEGTLGAAAWEIALWLREHPGDPGAPFIVRQGRIMSPGDILKLVEQPDFPFKPH